MKPGEKRVKMARGRESKDCYCSGAEKTFLRVNRAAVAAFRGAPWGKAEGMKNWPGH